MDHSKNVPSNTSWDRVLILKPAEGKKALDVSGRVDGRLFTGENRLHAIKNKQTCLWTLRYDAGLVQEPLRQSFTTFNKLLDFVTAYFKRRNVDVKEVVDA